MNFISWAFVLLFIPVLLARLLVGRRKTENSFTAVILLASTIFVMWHVPQYLLIMLTSIGVDYLAAIYIDRAPDTAPSRKIWLVCSISVNLALLAFFKYAGFFMRETGSVLALFGRHPSLPRLSWVLPMGISFYTFGSMSYTIDVYRRRIKPARRFLDFYYFITFFPHLVAGPIIRAEQFLYQFSRQRRLHWRVFNEGSYQIIRGVFLKMVCADNIAYYTAESWQDPHPHSASATLLLAILFAAQIFCDFEGYTCIARGLAYWLGFRFPINFRFPYIASTFSDFWKRWHITLSTWLGDYLYIPLGGNRGSTIRTYFNLLIVMILGGLWHGASLTFLLWGAVHGVALALERLLGLHRAAPPRLLKFAWFLLAQSTILLAWIFFRAKTIGQAGAFFHTLVVADFQRPPKALLVACLFLPPVIGMHVYGYLAETGRIPRLSPLAKAVLAGLALYGIISLYGPNSDFIYFQF